MPVRIVACSGVTICTGRPQSAQKLMQARGERIKTVLSVSTVILTRLLLRCFFFTSPPKINRKNLPWPEAFASGALAQLYSIRRQGYCGQPRRSVIATTV